MSVQGVRVRFAPSPTGIMHIGNIRAALLNYLFAKQKNGTFVLRIEDTDPARNFDVGAKIIISDLAWLGLSYTEGPDKDGQYAPYFQSKRVALYQEKLEALQAKELVYPCFCSEKDLDIKRERQRALKLPPRYDKTCARLSAEQRADALEQKIPFVWRFKLDHDTTITIKDLARGTVTFDLKNFSDFPLTRSDGSFTFMFANFVDDMMMKINYVFRGEDHQSNTAGQAALYQAFDTDLPTFWHMPIICNTDGKKLSKRDFGFSLHDLKKAGYLSQAITNYLAIIGGSFKQEIMGLDELAIALNFDNLSTASSIKYDVEKLRWINHQWINRLEPMALAEVCLPFLQAAYPQASIDTAILSNLLQVLKTDLYTLQDSVEALRFYFEKPEVNAAQVKACVSPEHTQKLREIIQSALPDIDDISSFVLSIKTHTKKEGIPLKQLFWLLRLALTGNVQGPGILELIQMLGVEESKQRIVAVLSLM